MQLIEYNDISKLLDLNIEDKEFDELCLSSAYTEIEKQLGYSLELKERCETKRVKDNRIILDTINIVKVNEINDITKKNEITNFTVDYQNKSIYFVPCKAEDHLIFITYESGYAKDTIPADIKEAIINSYNKAIHTILTSASILVIVTLIVGNFAISIAARICKTISQGTLCSAILILVLLPAVLAACDKIIMRKKKIQ